MLDVFNLRWRDVSSYPSAYLRELERDHPEAYKWLADFEAMELYGYKGSHNEKPDDNVLVEHYPQEELRRVWREEYKRKMDAMRYEHTQYKENKLL